MANPLPPVNPNPIPLQGALRFEAVLVNDNRIQVTVGNRTFEISVSKTTGATDANGNPLYNNITTARDWEFLLKAVTEPIIQKMGDQFRGGQWDLAGDFRDVENAAIVSNDQFLQKDVKVISGKVKYAERPEIANSAAEEILLEPTKFPILSEPNRRKVGSCFEEIGNEFRRIKPVVGVPPNPAPQPANNPPAPIQQMETLISYEALDLCKGRAVIATANNTTADLALADQLKVMKPTQYTKSNAETAKELRTKVSNRIKEDPTTYANDPAVIRALMGAHPSDQNNLSRNLNDARERVRPALSSFTLGIIGEAYISHDRLREILVLNNPTPEEKNHLVSIYAEYITEENASSLGEIFIKIAAQTENLDITVIESRSMISSTFPETKQQVVRSNCAFIRQNYDNTYSSYSRAPITGKADSGLNSAMRMNTKFTTTDVQRPTSFIVDAGGGGDCGPLSLADQLSKMNPTNTPINSAQLRQEVHNYMTRDEGKRAIATDSVLFGLIVSSIKDDDYRQIPKNVREALARISAENLPFAQYNTDDKNLIINYRAGRFNTAGVWVDKDFYALYVKAKPEASIAILRFDPTGKLMIDERFSNGPLDAEKTAFIYYNGARTSGNGYHFQSNNRDRNVIQPLIVENICTQIANFCTRYNAIERAYAVEILQGGANHREIERSKSTQLLEEIQTLKSFSPRAFELILAQMNEVLSSDGISPERNDHSFDPIVLFDNVTNLTPDQTVSILRTELSLPVPI